MHVIICNISLYFCSIYIYIYIYIYAWFCQRPPCGYMIYACLYIPVDIERTSLYTHSKSNLSRDPRDVQPQWTSKP